MDIRDTLSSAVWLFIAVFVLAASYRMGIGELHNPGPGFFPFWASVFLAILSFVMLGVNLFKKREPAHLQDLWKGLRWGNTIIVTVSLGAYCLALPKLGYLLATFGLMLILFTVGKMKPWMIFLYSLLAVLASYGLFYHGLKTPLPRGILFF